MYDGWPSVPRSKHALFERGVDGGAGKGEGQVVVGGGKAGEKFGGLETGDGRWGCWWGEQAGRREKGEKAHGGWMEDLTYVLLSRSPDRQFYSRALPSLSSPMLFPSFLSLFRPSFWIYGTLRILGYAYMVTMTLTRVKPRPVVHLPAFPQQPSPFSFPSPLASHVLLYA